jgi:hypothetical protein
VLAVLDSVAKLAGTGANVLGPVVNNMLVLPWMRSPALLAISLDIMKFLNCTSSKDTSTWQRRALHTAKQNDIYSSVS